MIACAEGSLGKSLLLGNLLRGYYDVVRGIMKRIGLLTLRPSDNYGGIFQAAALYHHLKNYAEEVVLIQKVIYRPLWKRLTVFMLERMPFQNIKGFRASRLKAKANKAFIERYLSVKTPPLTTLKEMEQAIKGMDLNAIVVGSDQVWRWDYINDGYYTAFFLDFDLDPSVRKISYAASFGKDHWQTSEKNPEVTRLLADFDAVSTREDTGVSICQNTFGRSDCQHVLDPTLLVGKSFFKNIIEQTPPLEASGYLLTYVLDPNASVFNLITAVLSDFDGGLRHVDIASYGKTIDATEWLRLFSDADFVVTDSFHGMVFSILFNKKFVVVGNRARGGARFYSLLKQLNLSSCLVDVDVDEISFGEIERGEVDWESVEQVLNLLREDSLAFLESALRGK